MNQNIALIKNSISRLNQKEDAQFTQFALEWLGKNYYNTSSIQEMEEGIARFAFNKVDCIIIDGGDGTISLAMTAIYHAYPHDNLPKLIILPSGNTNLIAKDIGFGVRGVEALRRIKILADRNRLGYSIKHRCALKMEWSEKERPSILGMFYGMAAFTRAINIAHSPTFLKHYTHDWAVAITIITSLLKLIFPQTRALWFGGVPCRMQFNDQEPQKENCFLFLATTLQSLSHSVWPFWDEKMANQGVNYLNVKAYPSQLLFACYALLRGRAPFWLRQNQSYQSGTVKKITAHLEQEVIMDGEHFDTGKGHCITLSTGPEFSFVQL